MFIIRVFTEGHPDRCETSEEIAVLDAETVQRWAAQADFVATLRRWTWAREALPVLLRQLARQACAAADLAAEPTVEEAALARVFWPWASTFDDNARLEPFDPVDYAHYACGVLLAHLLSQRPLRLAGRDVAPEALRAVEVRVCTGAALTLLLAWRQALQAGPLVADLEAAPRAHWMSYLQAITEDPQAAVAYLDLFTGREPVWRYPLVLVERPPFREALARRREPAD